MMTIIRHTIPKYNPNEGARKFVRDDKDIEQIKRTMLERVESIEPRIRDYAEEWHINIFRQKDLRWRYKKNSAYHYIWCWRYS